MTRGPKPRQAPCPFCGTWVCSDCDGINPDMPRYSEEPIICRTCHSPDGVMRHMIHRTTPKVLEHNQAAEDNDRDGLVARYPLLAPRTRVPVTEDEMAYLFRHSSRKNPVSCEWGTGNILVGPTDYWITQTLQKLRDGKLT